MSGSVDIGFGGVTPTTAAMTPIAQQRRGNYDTMTAEQLAEYVARTGGSSPSAAQALAQKRIMSTQQPTAPAQSADVQPVSMNFAQGGLVGPPTQYALGGMLKPSGGISMHEGAIHPPSGGGFLHTAGPGRTDNLSIKPHAQSYVVPADVVSGLGEGNSLAGAKAFEHAIHSAPYGAGTGGPFGVSAPAGKLGHPMGARGAGSGFGHAAGGVAGFGHSGDPAPEHPPERVPILAAGGEYVVSPERVKAIGHGDIERGHEILDAFVLHVRKNTIAEMKRLKGPVKT